MPVPGKAKIFCLPDTINTMLVQWRSTLVQLCVTRHNVTYKGNDMKIHYILILLFVLQLIACNRKLDLNVIENKEIKIEYYKISEITTIHDFVDITNKRWNKTERICEANAGSIDSIFIRNDSIILQASITALMYDLAALKFGYKIIVEK